MTLDGESARNVGHERHGDRLLTSWREIADFVGRSERTVRRWVEFYDFPIHRNDRGVHAKSREIDEWMATPLSFRSDLDLTANRRWNADLRMDAKEAVARSRDLRKQAQSERAVVQRWHRKIG